MDDITPQFPELLLNLVNTGQEPLPDGVFAVPTYLLNGKVISLGNPTRSALVKKLASLFPKESARIEMPQKDEMT